MGINQLEFEPGEWGGFELDGELLLFQNVTEGKLIFNYTCYNLTRVGLELYPVVYTACENNTYLQELGRALREKNDALKVSIHPISNMDTDVEHGRKNKHLSSSTQEQNSKCRY